MAELLTAATPISYYLIAVNIIAFILYGTDKAKAMLSGGSKRQC